MFPKRHQDEWKLRSNNACLYGNATSSDIQNVYKFCQQYNDYLTQFVFHCIEMPKTVKFVDAPMIIDDQENLVMVIQILKQQKFIFIDTISQTKNSYKGYISWLLIATSNQLYLIDSAKLHDKCYELKEIISDRKLIKFMHDCQQALFTLKRDFQIFVPNIFDLQVIQRYLFKKGKISTQPKNIFKQYVNSLNPHFLGARPIRSELLGHIQDYYENEMNLLMNLDKFFSSQDPQYQCYAYFNNYQLLLKSYFHHIPTVHQLDQLLKIKHGMTQNVFSQYGHHRQINLLRQNSNLNKYWVKEIQQEQMAELLCEWRQHIAKIKDINAQQVLQYQTLSNIAKTKINSILQISQLCSPRYYLPHKIYSLSLEQFQQIFQLFQLYKEQKQESEHELIIPRRLPYYKVNQQKPIKQLFEELKFIDNNNDWLNKKTDQSVRLYKEIVSINEFDNSIVQQYFKQINFQDNNCQHLKIEDINRFVKYAQHLRNGNHKKLQQLYQKTKSKLKCNQSSDQQSFQENFIQGQYCDEKNWDQIQNEINFPTMDTINQKSSESLTSIKSYSNLEVQSCKTLIVPKSSSILKQNKLNSLNQLQSPSFLCKVQPLPQNIEAIYLQAAKAKKNYVSKGQKKGNKANKKESKTKIQSKNIKKQQQFIPKKQEIFNLIHY